MFIEDPPEAEQARIDNDTAEAMRLLWKRRPAEAFGVANSLYEFLLSSQPVSNRWDKSAPLYLMGTAREREHGYVDSVRWLLYAYIEDALTHAERPPEDKAQRIGGLAAEGLLVAGIKQDELDQIAASARGHVEHGDVIRDPAVIFIEVKGGRLARRAGAVLARSGAGTGDAVMQPDFRLHRALADRPLLAIGAGAALLLVLLAVAGVLAFGGGGANSSPTPPGSQSAVGGTPTPSPSVVPGSSASVALPTPSPVPSATATPVVVSTPSEEPATPTPTEVPPTPTATPKPTPRATPTPTPTPRPQPTSVTLANALIVPLHVTTSESEKVDISAGESATVAISSPRLTVEWESDKLVAPNGFRVGQKVSGSMTVTRNSLREDSTVEITALSGQDPYFMPKLKTTGTNCRWIGNAMTDIEKAGPYRFDVLRGKGQQLGYYRYVPNDSNLKLICEGVVRWWGANDLDGDGKLSGPTFSVDELDPKTGVIIFDDENEAH